MRVQVVFEGLRPARVWVEREGPVLVPRVWLDPARAVGELPEWAVRAARQAGPPPASEPWICWLPGRSVVRLPGDLGRQLAALTPAPQDLPAIWQRCGPLTKGVDFARQRRELRDWAGALPPGARAVPLATALAALGVVGIAVALAGCSGQKRLAREAAGWADFDAVLQAVPGLEGSRPVGAWWDPVKGAPEVGFVRERPPEVGDYYLRLPRPQGDVRAWVQKVLRDSAGRFRATVAAAERGLAVLVETVYQAALLQLALPREGPVCECGCGRPVPPGRQRYATDACRKRAWRQRQKRQP